MKNVSGFATNAYETAFFYFNDPNNIELLLKVLDQGNVNGEGKPTIAVLFGSATPLRTELTLTDTRTSEWKKYTTPFGAMQGYTDFTAFIRGGVPAWATSVAAGAGHESAARAARHLSTNLVPAAPCVVDARTICMLGGRFQVNVRYRGGFDNGAVDASALVKTVSGFASPTRETAFFYFNDPNNIEVLLKLLDQGNVDSTGRPTIAVLFGTATPLRTEITITDTQTGVQQTYASDFGSMRGLTDFGAFLRGFAPGAIR